MSYTKKNKLIFSIAIAFMMMLSMFIMSGCYTVYTFHTIAQSGLSINKIIYTDNYEKYISGRTVIETLQCGNTTILSGGKGGQWFLATDTPNEYDIVLTTVPVKYDGETNGSYYPMGYAADLSFYVMDDTGEYTILDNSYLFSGKTGHYLPGGRYGCSVPNCIGQYDSIDHNCMCNRWANPLTTNTRKTDAEVRAELGLCPGCTTITETDNGDGTYTYTIIDSCSCKGFFYHDGTWTREYESWLQIASYGYVSSFRFKELVIDGYDFSFLDDYITSYDYDKYYTNWEDLFDPSNFSHMFSDLPIEKITIKKVYGLGEKAIDLSSMFENCINLKTVEFGNLFENCKPTNISRMFYNCPNLQSVDLTSLDTSEAADMSEIFAIGTSKMTFAERDEIVEDFFNNTFVKDYPEDFDDNTIYTVTDIASYFELTTTELYPHLILLAQQDYPGQLNYPVTYNECSVYAYQQDFDEFCKNTIADPTSIGLPAGPYSISDIIGYVESTATAYGLNAVYDADFTAKNRKEYITYTINNLYVPVKGMASKTYTITSFATALGLSNDEAIFEVAYSTGLNIPVTLEEAVMANFGMTLEEAVIAINQDPSFVGLEPKEGGEPYTLEELSLAYTLHLENLGMTILTEEEILIYYITKEVTPRGVLTLGGENSKFVIKEGTDTAYMFGDYCYFATVITPNEIGENVEIPLQNTFTNNDVDIVTKLTAADASKVFTYVELYTPEPEPEEPDPDEPETPTPDEPGTEEPGSGDPTPSDPETPNNEAEDNDNNLYVLIAIIAGGVAVLATTIGIIAKVIIRKKKPMTIKGQRL